jgi:hypothetical protein
MGGNVFGFGDRRFFGLDQQTGQLRGGEHLLRALLQAKGGELLRELNSTSDPGRLRELADSFGRTGGLSPSMLANVLREGGIPPALNMPSPDMQNCNCGSSYAAQPGFDFGAETSPLGRFLAANPFERQQIEMTLGGRIRPNGDGRLSVVPFSPGEFPAGGRENAAAFNAQAMLGDFARAASMAQNGQINPNVFQGMMLGALMNMASRQQGAGANARSPSGGSPANSSNPEGFSSLRSRGTNPFVDWNEDSPNMARRRAAAGMGGNGAGPGVHGSGMGGGDGMGMDMDRSVGGDSGGMDRSSGTDRCGGGGCGGGDDISAMLADGGLTVEDKITLMIMMIMKKMDQDIEKQANYINSLQQQQQSGGGAGGKGGGGGGGAPSIDVETMKLKRLIDKRSQMFDMLRQIIDKYNQTAKGIIDSMRQ